MENLILVKGHLKDVYNPKDWKFLVPAGAVSPDEFSLDKYLPPAVYNQGQIASCVSQGAGNVLDMWAIMQAIYGEPFSRWWLHNGARFIEGTLTQNAGTYPRDVLEWARMMGCLLGHFWPYKNGETVLDMTSPPSKFNPEAAKYPLLEYRRITGGVESICLAISQGNPVLFGGPWFPVWDSPGPGGRLADVTASDWTDEGHGYCFYGYSKPNTAIASLNSWGPGWGDHGKFLLPFQAFNYFGKFGGYDAYVVTVKWVTPEPPQPKGCLLWPISLVTGAWLKRAKLINA